jgi:glycosyltransferase involved in cell wall biosynthesis
MNLSADGASTTAAHHDAAGRGTDAAARLRVLWLIKGLGPGGAERLLVSAAGAHDVGRFELHAAYINPLKGHLVRDLQALGVEVHQLGFADDGRATWVRRLHGLLRYGDFDVVHLHSPLVAGTARLLIRTLPSRRRPALVSTEHNEWRTFALPTRLLNGLTWGLDQAHVAVSDQVRASIRPKRYAARAEVIVHGTDVAALVKARGDREGARRRLGIADHEVVVGTVANYRAQKAYPDLLAAARTVVDTDATTRFLAVGQGPLEAEITARHAELGLGDRFRLLGYQPDPAAVLAACDVFVMASHVEGYPVAIMEALGMGLPVVSTAVGGIPDAVRDGIEGRLVPPGRPAELADALLDVVGDGERRRHMAAAALERGERYDIGHATRRIEALYLAASTDQR